MTAELKQLFQEAVVAARHHSELKTLTGRYLDDPTPTVNLPDNMIWVREGDGIPFPVLNLKVRTISADVPVTLDPLENGGYQIKEVEPVAGTQALGVAASDFNMADPHAEMAPIVPNANLRELRLRLSETGGLVLTLEGGVLELDSGDLLYVAQQDIDLASDLPTTGMKVPIVLGLDSTGVLVAYSGTELALPLPPTTSPYFLVDDFVDVRNAATGADIWLWGLALLDGQTSFRSVDDFVHLRPYLSLAGSSGGTVTGVTGTSPISVDNTDPANPVVEHAVSGVAAATYAYPASVTVNATGHVTALVAGSAPAAPTGELLMQDGVTAPPVPIENEAQDDWLYFDI